MDWFLYDNSLRHESVKYHTEDCASLNVRRKWLLSFVMP